MSRNISIHVLRVEDDRIHCRAGSAYPHFNPRPPCGGRRKTCHGYMWRYEFQSTSSVWRTTLRSPPDTGPTFNFNPRPPCGGRLPMSHSPPSSCLFQSTSSVWRTTAMELNRQALTSISIHVLRVEDDPDGRARKHREKHFNPRPPCGGRLSQRHVLTSSDNFNPRPPCGGRHQLARVFTQTSAISIHVLRVEDDCAARCRFFPARNFNPRPPCGGRRPVRCAAPAALPISIHVLRVEDDRSTFTFRFHRSDFNPRPPCGGRHADADVELRHCVFQSTSSVWRTTAVRPRPRWWRAISIHVLRVEDDSATWRRSLGPSKFQSTSSVWRTTAKTEKNLYLHSYNTAICTNLQPKHSVYAFVCTDKDKQSHEKLVRSIRVCSARFMFARPLSPDGALRKSERHPAGRRGELRCVPLCFGNGCPAGKSAGCPLPGRSVWSARP